MLSPGNADTDRIVNNREYAATPSVRRTVMPEQDRVAATVFARQEAGWIRHLVGEGETLHLPEIGLELPLAERYEGVDLRGASGEDVRGEVAADT